MAYDLLVIGGGPGGYVAAIKGARLGLATALVEERELGGTCLNRGCIPTKALLHTAGLFRNLQDAASFGVLAEGLRLDLAAAHAHKAGVVQKQREGIAALLKAAGVEVLCGRARVQEVGRVLVEPREGAPLALQAQNILLATGAAPVRLPVPGADLPGVLTSDDLLEGDPGAIDGIAIVGGGVIGVEFATMLAAFGTRVTVLEAEERLLPGMDRRISQTLGMVFRKQGIEVATGARLQAIEPGAEGLVCRYSHKGGEKTLVVQKVLMAVGRRPSLEGLFAEGLAPKVQNGGLVVDETFATSLPGVYAIGDMVAYSVQLAHAASAQGINAVCGIAGREAEMDLSTIPSCVYTEPEIACVGVCEPAATEAQAGLVEKTGLFNIAGLGKAAVEGAGQGFIKLVFGPDDTLVGAQLMCPRATDMIGGLTTAVANGLTLAQLAGVVRPHPTYNEGITEAAEDALGRAIHKIYRQK